MTAPPPGPSRPHHRVALLGAGGIADCHAIALRALPDVELCAVADIHQDRAAALRERWQIPAAFTALEAMLAEARPDVVHVLLPPELHARFAIQAMAGGAHVFVEKPLCVSEPECAEVAAAAALHRRVVGLNHSVTFEPAFQELVQVVRDRHLGALEHVLVWWNVSFGMRTLQSSWYRHAGPAAVLLETGVHPMSLIERLMGEVTAASALVSGRTGPHPDTWQVALECQRGTAQLFLAIGRTFTDTRVLAVGQDGSALADMRLGHVTVSENTTHAPLFAQLADSVATLKAIGRGAGRARARRARRLPGGAAADDTLAAISASVAAFYRALRDGARPPVSLAEGLAVTRSCLRVIGSLPATRPQVELKPWPATASS